MPDDPRDLAADALLAMEREDAWAKEVLEGPRARLADPRDRGLLTEVVYGTVRHRPTIDHLLSAFGRTPLARLHPPVRAALRVGLYQSLYLARVPPHAAVNAAVRYASERTHPRLGGYANGVLRTILRAVAGPAEGPEDPARDLPREDLPALRFRRPVFPDAAAHLAENLAARFAHPAWLVARWVARHGLALARSLLEAGVQRAPLVLRAPPLGREDLLARLAAAGARGRAGEGTDEVVVEEGEAEAIACVRAGAAAVQDGTAQRVAPLLDPRPGDRLLDLCAAPGGKSLHLADLLGGRGEVVACDAAPDKVEALARAFAARPSGGVLLRAVAVPPEGVLPFPPASFHGVLVDAPCANTGVLRRRPEARWRLAPSDVEALAALARRLLDRAAPLVRPGGRLVHATCSIEPEENEGQAEAFLLRHPGWKALPGCSVLPCAAHDGGWAVVFVAP